MLNTLKRNIIFDMKRKLLLICSFLVGLILSVIIESNILVAYISKGKCYDDVEAIPHNTFGMLLGTGRSSAPSPYYDARIQAATELYQAGKVDFIIVSGEKLYDDYNEVDSMVVALEKAGVQVIQTDYHGTDTYTSLNNYGSTFGYSYPSLTIISQPYHNQRAVFYGAWLFHETPIAYNSKDTDLWYWNIWRFFRESLARTKAVIFLPFM